MVEFDGPWWKIAQACKYNGLPLSSSCITIFQDKSPAVFMIFSLQISSYSFNCFPKTYNSVINVVSLNTAENTPDG